MKKIIADTTIVGIREKLYVIERMRPRKIENGAIRNSIVNAERYIMVRFGRYARPFDLGHVLILPYDAFGEAIRTLQNTQQDFFVVNEGFYDSLTDHVFVCGSLDRSQKKRFLHELPDTLRHELVHAHAFHKIEGENSDNPRVVQYGLATIQPSTETRPKKDGRGLNEGLTEYLANEDGSVNIAYGEQRSGVKILIRLVGLKPFLKAYFQGNISHLERVIDARLGQGTYAKLIQAGDRARAGEYGALTFALVELGLVATG